MQETVDLKLVLLGNPGVGKTAIVCRYLYNSFGDSTSTIGASFAMKKIEASAGTCTVGIWDTAGQERFDSLSSFYCRGARAAFVVYDVTDRASFDACHSKWLKKVKEEAERGCHVTLVGTKVDLVRDDGAARGVSEEEVRALASKHGADVVEMSAKDGSGVAETFVAAVERYCETAAERAQQPGQQTIGAPRCRAASGGRGGAWARRASAYSRHHSARAPTVRPCQASTPAGGQSAKPPRAATTRTTTFYIFSLCGDARGGRVLLQRRGCWAPGDVDRCAWRCRRARSCVTPPGPSRGRGRSRLAAVPSGGSGSLGLLYHSGWQWYLFAAAPGSEFAQP